MAYFGVQPSSVFTGSGAKNVFNGDGSTTAFTMSQAVLETTNIEVFVGNVRQEPSVAYTVSGFTLTFTGTPASGTGNIYVVHQNSNSDTVAVTPGLALAPSTLAVTGTSTLTGNVTAAGTLGVTGATTAAAITASGLVTANADMLIGGATPTLTIGDAGAEDAKIVFDGNAQDFHVGLDDSSDDLVIGLGSALGTTPAISIDENVLVTINDDVNVVGRSTGTITTDNDGNFNLTVSNNWKCTTSADLTLTLTNPAIGQSGNILFINDANRTISAHASLLINADVLSAISATGSYHLTYYATATSGNNTILVSASAILT